MRLIDAEAKTFPTPYKYNDTKYAEGWNACLSSIAQQPTIDAAPVVHGEWIIDLGENTLHGVNDKCTICGFRNFSFTSFNYCPICGAKMDGDTICE